MTDALKPALDRFDVPPLSAGLADRIVVAATTSTAAPFVVRGRDRRGHWRRGRQVLLGSLAAGMLSAGAVASGLLGRVGIEVPVLTAMLAPKSSPVGKPAKAKPKPAAVRSAKAVTPPPVVEPVVANLPLSPAERFALREERRERRQAFAAAHPVAAAVIRENVRRELQWRAYVRQQALTSPGIDPSLAGDQHLDPADRLTLARAARRDRLAAEWMIDRRIRAREARMAERAIGRDAGSTGPDSETESTGQPAPPSLAEARAARRERLQQVPPEERALRLDRMQERRAQRRAQQGRD